MKKRVFIVLFILLFNFYILSVYAEEHLLPLQGTAKLNEVSLVSGDIIIEIYDAPTAGNLVYNSTNDFLNVISGGKYDILIGNGTQPLSLIFGKKYYMDMYLDGVDLDFNSSERQVFMSTIGNISLTTPISTSSTDVDDALNVSVGGMFIGGNVVFNNFFNITTTTSSVKTNGTVTILNSAEDDALNLTFGGLFVGRNATIGQMLKVTSIDEDDAVNISQGGLFVSKNVTIGKMLKINSGDSDDALNVTGGVKFGGKMYAEGNITINKSVNILGSGGNDGYGLTIANGGAYIVGNLDVIDSFNQGNNNFNINSDGEITSKVISIKSGDDALDIQSGGAIIKGNLTVGNSGFKINSTGQVNTRLIISNKTIITLKDEDDALNITQGGIFVAQNITIGQMLNIKSDDSDDALNVSVGGAYINGQLVVQNQMFPGNNVIGNNNGANFDWAGKTIIRSSDNDDAFNVSNGGANIFGGITIGNNGLSIDSLGQIISAVTIKQSLTVNGNITTTSNVTADYFYGNGSQLEGISVIEVQDFQNVTTINGTTSNKITITNSGVDDALNVTGGVKLGGTPVYNDRFTVDNNGIVIVRSPNTNDAVNLTRGGLAVGGGLFVVSKTGGVTMQNSDIDALNVSAGGLFVFRNATINQMLTIKSDDSEDALNVTIGGAFIGQNVTIGQMLIVSGKDNDDTLNVTFGGAFFGQNLFIGQNATIGQKLNINGNDPDGTLNVSGGAIIGNNAEFVSIQAGPGIINIFNVMGLFNITGLSGTGGFSAGDIISGGRFFIKSTAEDALNVSAGNAQIGFNGSTVQSHLTIYGGGTNKCSYLVLYNETGGPNYLFVTNQTLRISDQIPAACDNTEGHFVGNDTYTRT